jgi:hypothetical protein
MPSRASRSARALSAAFASTAIAALSHDAGGGEAPGALVLMLALALSSVVCIALSGRSLSLWRLALSVGLSQAAFHLLFSVFGGRALRAPAGTHSHQALPMPDHMTGVAHSDGTMWLAHAAAAVLTVVALRHGERVLIGLLATILLRTLRRLPSRVVAPVAPAALPLHPAPHPFALRFRAIGGWRHRGPPLSV